MIADNLLGQKRENFQVPLPKEYIDAFEDVQSDKDQELMVMEGTIPCSMLGRDQCS